MSVPALEGRTLGEFTVHERLGAGGFGEVYRAQQPILDREVVIKVLRVRHRGNRRIVQRFLKEARIASRLDHPFAAHVYAFGAEPDGLLWIAMELVRGTTLATLIQTQGPMPLDRFVPLFERLCEVVHTAHEQHIIHRDIKPPNVMVLSRAGRYLPKLLDFGVSKLAGEDLAPHSVLEAVYTVRTRRPSGDDVDSATPDGADSPALRAGTMTMTRYGVLVGTPLYLAPELWAGVGEASPRSDQYALGILAYETLTGTVPFAGDNQVELARAHTEDAVPPLPAALPAALQPVLARALAKRADDRYETVLELAAAFRAASGHKRPEELPRLDDAMSHRWIAEAPPPLAESIAALAAASDAGGAREAVHAAAGLVVRFLAILALVGKSRLAIPASARATALLQGLRDHDLGDAEWLELAGELTAASAELPDAHPVPELVRLFHPPAGGEPPAAALAPLVAPPRGAREPLEQTLASLRRALDAVGFLLEYPLLVPRGRLAERWMGIRGRRRPTHELGDAPPPDGVPILCDADLRPVLSLAPLLVVAEPAPGAPPELFHLAGSGRGGARLEAFPVGFERHDAAVWDWLGETILGPADAERQSSTDARPPFRGLEPFDEADAELFFGREREAQAAANRLRVSPLLAVVGPSGAGKTSFVRAGVLPLLPAGWRAVVIRPGAAPMSTLARALGGPTPAPDTVLVVDQLEELLTLCADETERLRFAETVAAAARTERVRVVVTARDDFLVRLETLGAFHRVLSPGLFLLTTPPEEDLRRILEEPLRRVGYDLDDRDLPRRMAAEVAGHPGALTLLSFTAARLWELRDRHFHKLTLRAYEALGGVGGALAQHAEETLAAMPPHQQLIVRRAFRHLVTADGTRAVVGRRELADALGDDAAIARLLEARLLVSSEGEGGDARLEIVHETLLTAWPRLVDWRRDDAEGARLRDQLRAAAAQWEARGRPRGLLWRDDALAEYRRWRTRHPEPLPTVDETFARTSLAAAARVRRRRTFGIVGGFVSLLVGVLGLWTLREKAESRLTQLYAEQGRQLALAGDGLRALPYLVEAYRRGAHGAGLAYLLARATGAVEARRLTLPHVEVVGRVRFIAGGRWILTVCDGGMATLWDAASGAPLRVFRHRDDEWATMHDAEADGEAERLVTASEDSTARVWDIHTGQLVAVLPHGGPVRYVVFSRDNSLLLSASGDNLNRVWDTRTWRLLATLPGHAGGMSGASEISPDGNLVVSHGQDGTVSVWEWRTGRRVALLEHKLRVLDSDFSRDGRLLATAGTDKTLRLWRLPEVTLAATGEGHTAKINRAKISPDGKLVVTASDDKTAKIWDAATGALRHTLVGHGGAVRHAEFDARTKKVVTASTDGTVRLWDVEDGHLISVLAGHRGEVLDARFDPSGGRIVSASGDFTARVWDAGRDQLVLRLRGHTGRLRDARFSPDGTRILSSGADNTARVWDAGTGAELLTLRHPATVWTARYRPDGARIVTACDDGNVRVWEAADGQLVATLRNAEQAADARYSPDGARIAVVASDGRVRVWDAASATEVLTFEPSQRPGSLAWSPDGTRLFTASYDTGGMWDARTGVAIYVATGMRQPQDVNFSPDGRLVLAASRQRVALLLDAATGAVRETLEGHVSWVTDAVFSPDGELIVTASLDGTAKIWETRSGNLVGTLSAASGWIDGAAFSPDGSRLVTAGPGLAVHVWDVHRDRRSAAELAPLAGAAPAIR